MQEVIGSTPIFSTTDSKTAFLKGRRFFMAGRGIEDGVIPTISTAGGIFCYAERFVEKNDFMELSSAFLINFGRKKAIKTVKKGPF